MRTFDYIIVGQGLAGSILAHTLLERGCTVLIVDHPEMSSSSRVAAGLYNPVVFKRLVKSWMADELIPYMDSFYPKLEKILGERFYYKKEIIKIFTDESEKKLWLSKVSELPQYLDSSITLDWLPDLINNKNGIAAVRNCGNLNTSLFLESSREFFKDFIFREKFSFEELKFSEQYVEYRDIKAGKIIFCEGYRVMENPFFSYLPFKLTKGELLTIEIDGEIQLPERSVINKGVFILPIGKGQYKVGATYNWSDLTEAVTEAGRNELILKIDSVIKMKYRIINQEAGIRPTTNDRRPMLGLHPQNAAVGIFNGMGTKAVMLAPFFASVYADFLLNNSFLNQDVNISRFNYGL